MTGGHAPASSASILARPRLLDRLRAVDGQGLAVVVAPGGFGKTTLLQQWSAGRSGRVLWCTPTALPDAATVLGRSGGWPGVSGVVIDDVRAKESDPSTARLVQLVAHLAPRIPVVIATHRMPAFNFASHEFPTPVVVTSRDLAFRSWEIADLFAEAYRDPLDVEEPLSIAERTDGWAAALRLWHLSRQLRQVGEPEHSDAVPAAFAGLLRCYVEREVLFGLGVGARRLLVRSAVFDSVTAERLDLLLGRRDCHRALTRIARKVPMVGTAVGTPNGPAYRYHVALRAHLRSELDHELGVTGARHLYARAAEVAEALGDLGEAGAARCRARDAAGLAALINRHGPSRVSAAPGLLDVLTPELSAQHPTVAVTRARLLLAEGRAHEADREAVLPQEVWARQGDDVTDGPPPIEVPVAPRVGSAGAEALRLLARQGPRRARQALDSGSPWLDPEGHLVAELALAAGEVLVDPSAGLAGLERAHDEILGQGSRWLRRLSYAVARSCTAEPRRCAEMRRLATTRERLGDSWGAALIESAVAAALLRHGRPDADLLEGLCDRFRLLGAPTLEAWARSALALVSAQGEFPDSDLAASTVAFARAADSPGALAIAYAALALGAADPSPPLLALAQATALAGGLPYRPWTWSRDPAPGVGSATTPQAARLRPGVHGQTRSAPGDTHTFGCFGAFTVNAPGGSDAMGGVRPVALTVLRMLAVHAGHAVHRDVLVEAQWPDLPEQAAMHNLHVSVSTLRRGLERLAPGRSRQLLARQGQAYVLAPDVEAVTDLQRFDRYLDDATRCRRAGERTGQAAALRAALELYVGEVLPGDGTAEWVVPVRERYRLRAAGAASQLAELELRRERTVAAVAAAQRSVQIDPWCDASWQTLIAAHVQAGRPAEAERAKLEYAAVLRSLGISTMPVKPAAAVDPGRSVVRPSIGVRTA